MASVIAGSGYVQAVLLGDTCAEDGVLPICVVGHQRVEFCQCVRQGIAGAVVTIRVSIRQILESGIVIRPQHGEPFRYFRQTDIDIQFYAVFAQAPFSCRDQYDAICAAGSIDGGSGCIFEDIDGFDIVWIDEREDVQGLFFIATNGRRGSATVGIVERDTIDDVQGFRPAEEGVGSPNSDAEACTGCTIVLSDIDACQLTLHGLLYIQRIIAQEIITIDPLHGAGQICLADCSVSDYHYIRECGCG